MVHRHLSRSLASVALASAPAALTARVDEEQLCSCLAEAARCGDECRVRELAWELVGRSLPQARKTVPRLLPAPRWCRQDREDVVSAANVRLFVALLGHDEEVARMPASVLAALCLRRAAVDFCRACGRRREREQPTDLGEMPEVPVDPPPSPVEQAAAVGELLEPMSDRERAIVYEHTVMDLDLAEIARGHGMSVAAIKKALVRGKGKAREARAGERGTDQADGAAGGSGSAPGRP
ncbi:MAG TPA: sigma-70 family RNA polymerase sigma factor [Solirubrobacteraceae bacterium]